MLFSIFGQQEALSSVAYT